MMDLLELKRKWLCQKLSNFFALAVWPTPCSIKSYRCLEATTIVVRHELQSALITVLTAKESFCNNLSLPPSLPRTRFNFSMEKEQGINQTSQPLAGISPLMLMMMPGSIAEII